MTRRRELIASVRCWRDGSCTRFIDERRRVRAILVYEIVFGQIRSAVFIDLTRFD